MKNKLFILSFTLIANFSFSQKGKLNDAQKKYDQLSYIKTTEQLLEAAEEGNVTEEGLEYLANAYYFNGKMDDASKWYKVLLEKYLVSDTETYFRYVQSLKALENYTEADVQMKRFAEVKSNDSRVKLFKSNQDYLNNINKLSQDFELNNLDVNTAFSDFGTSTNNGNLIFASSRDSNGRLYNWNQQPFLDLFQLSDDHSVRELDGDVNTRYHESSTTFTKDGTTMYFTRNNFFKGKFKKDSKNTHGLKIYKATFEDNEWTNIESLPFNSDEYNVAHPTLSVDEKKLYFASDMPGTIGASDIFVVTINDDDSYGTPTNLGAVINTEGRENFPYISEQGNLYFSSDGQIGLGGLDVFKVDSIENSIVSVTNLGKPINSSKDDFGYIIKESTREGYVTSNRAGGKGDDDIYSFVKNVCSQNVSGTVLDSDTNEIIVNANVTIYNAENKIIENLKSDINGAFNFALPCKENSFNSSGEKEKYNKGNQEFSIGSEGDDVQLTLKLKPEQQAAAVGTDLFKLLNLNPIYFDYDKSFIRPDAEIELAKIINYMRAFPNVKVDVRSHTDSRGRDAYNFALSNRRNKSTRDYIISVGAISADRLSGKGYGETELTNQCSNGVRCSKADHQANRRSEFIVIAN